jgi:hypothetical protein
MPRRKKKYMLLRGKFGSFIVVERRWYDFTGIAKKRGRNQTWVIAAQSDDHAMLQAMASLSERHVPMRVNIETEN